MCYVMSRDKSVTFTIVKGFVGKRVNIQLKDGSVIVNVLLERYVLSARAKSVNGYVVPYVVLKHNDKEQKVRLKDIVEIRDVNSVASV